MADKLRVGVLVSGGGSNLQAIIDACQRPDFPARVVVVGSNKQGAFGLTRAKNAGIPTFVVPHREYDTRQKHEEAIIRELQPYDVDLLVLAGYMRVVTALLLEHLNNPGRDLPGVVNIHPADTRAYQGAHGYEFAMGELPGHPERLSQTWITVHFVDSGVDTGPIIRQEPVPVHADDTIDTLKERGLKVEHQVYPEVIQLYAQGRIKLENNQVTIL